MQSTTILLAEDSEDDVFLMQHAFKKARVANPLFVVRDGEETIQYLEGSGMFRDRDKYPFPSLLLLDLKMPLKDGFEVLQWIRSKPYLKRLLVVVLTASNQEPDINRAYDLGANSYLVKPGRCEDLIEMVQRIGCYWYLSNQPPSCFESD
jgi:CheY-like chemotaxis protein